jgi:RNA polymerase sigma-70 factor (ECF subfamily)
MIASSIQTETITREDEAHLVELARAGDAVAHQKFVTQYGPAMMAVARRFMRCDDDCNDAVQDAFISAFRSLTKFEANSRLSTWLHRITVNACLMKLRSAGARRESSIEELLPTFDSTGHHARRVAAVHLPEEDIEAEETRAAVRHAIDQLPDAYRIILLMRDIEGLDTADTARLLATTENNVKTRLHRARQALRTILEPLMTAHS